MTVRYLFIIGLIFSYTCYPQLGRIKASVPAKTSSIQYDEFCVRSVLSELEFSLRNGKKELLIRNVSPEILSQIIPANNIMKLISVKDDKTIKCFVHLTDIKISFVDNIAEVEFIVREQSSDSSFNERMTLARASESWKIVKSSKFIEYFVNRIVTKVDDSNGDSCTALLNHNTKELSGKSVISTDIANTTDITLSVMNSNTSRTSLMQWPIMYEGTNPKYYIDKAYTKANIGRDIFNQPTDAKGTVGRNTNNNICVFADNKWSRIIIAGTDASRNNPWMKSYGDNTIDQSLRSPSSITLDQDGNIYVLDESTRKIFQLKYLDDVNHTITFVREVTLPGVQYPADICTDIAYGYNGAQNTIWVADKDGNAVHKITSDVSSGKMFTGVVNPSGQTITFTRPEKILANFDDSGQKCLAVIDSDKKRLIIVTSMSIPSGNILSGNFQVYNYVAETNSSLNSLSVYPSGPASALWVADPNNGAFHVFDVHSRTGYLGTVKANLSANAPWHSPKLIMSLSGIHTSGSPYVIDQWDENQHGITVYDQGADLGNITSVLFDNGLSDYGVNVTASCFDLQKIHCDLYRNGILINDLSSPALYLPSRGNIAHIGLTEVKGNPIGVLTCRFVAKSWGVLSQSDYSITKSIDFAMPLRAYFNGPSSFHGDVLTWNVTPTSGSGQFTYAWDANISGLSGWQSLNTNSPTCIWGTPGQNKSFTIRCVITDNVTQQTKTFSQFVSYITPYGELQSNEIWPSGTITLLGSVVVPPQYTLTISQDAFVYFPAGASLTVNGVLTVQGSDFFPVVFDRAGTSGTWGTITFTGAAAKNSILDHATISNGAGIQCISGADVTISHSVISNCTNGIYISSANPSIHDNSIKNNPGNGIYGTGTASNYANIYNNSITKESGTPGYHTCLGIYLINGMSTYAGHNDISGFNQGMYFGGGSTAQLGTLNDDRPMPNNRIQNCLTAITSSWGGVCDAGQDDHTHADNSIFGNTRSLLAANSSYIYADYNYWGGSNNTPSMYCDAGSVIVFDDLVAESDPWFGISSPKQDDAKTAVVLQKKEAPGKGSDIRVGLRLEQQGRIDEAVTLYKNMIKFDSFAEQAMSRIVSLNSRYKRGDDLDFLSSSRLKGNKHRTHIRKLLAGIQMKNGAYGQSAKLYDDIISDPSNDHEKYDAMFSKFFVLLHEANDADGAARILDALKKLPLKKVDDELVSRLDMAQTALDNSLGGKELMNRKAGRGTGVVIPTEYSLSNNYPNPFNPSTVIKYELPLNNMVSLKIYDILGREVKTLVNEIQNAGSYSVVFNGSTLASGVYIYTLRSGNFSATKKMMVVK